MIAYSGTPLIKKLGITDQLKLLIINPPGGIDVHWQLIAANCSSQICKPKERPGFVHLFVTLTKRISSTIQ